MHQVMIMSYSAEMKFWNIISRIDTLHIIIERIVWFIREDLDLWVKK